METSISEKVWFSCKPVTRLQMAFDRLLAERSLGQIVLLVVIVVVMAISLVVAGWGLEINKGQDGVNQEAWMQIMSVFIDAGNISNFNSEHYIFGMVIATAGMTLLTGLLVSVLTNAFDTHNERYRSGQLTYKHVDGHVVVVGFDGMVPALIAQLCADQQYADCWIIVQTTRNAEEVRAAIRARLHADDHKRILVYSGSRDTADELRRLCTWRATELFIFGEHNEADRDSMNLDCLLQLLALHKVVQQESQTEVKMPVTVFFKSQATYRAFQVTDLFEDVRQYFDFRPQNFYENWAKKLLVSRSYVENGKPQYYPALDREPMTEDCPKYVHLVVIGMGRMGTALGTMAAHVLHFPNFLNNAKLRTRITFIDPEADSGRHFYCGHYRHLFDISPELYLDYMGDAVDTATEAYLLDSTVKPFPKEQPVSNFLDVEFRFVRGRIESPQVQKLLAHWAQDTASQQLSIAICLSRPEENMGAALYMPDAVFDNDIPVFVRLQNSGTLLTMLHSQKGGAGTYRRYKNLYPFGMLNDCYELRNEELRRAKWFNMLYDMVGPYRDENKALPTEADAEQAWLKLPAALQWSNCYAVYCIPFRLRSMQLSEDQCENISLHQLEVMARVEHNRWNMEKLLLGYRPPRPDEWTKDWPKEKKAEKKQRRNALKARYIHVCITPYDQLEEGDKNYDKVMIQGLPVVLRGVRDEKWHRLLQDIQKATKQFA